MKCWHCQSELIWQSDHDLEDLGWDRDGILTEFKCSKCPAEVTVILPDESGTEDT